MQELRGSCFCGQVTYTVSGKPILSAYCHCTLCQRLTASPFVHTVHFEPSAFTWTHTESENSRLETYSPPSKPYKTRYRCKSCGSGVSSLNSKTNTCSVWGATFERTPDGKIKAWDIIKPTAHTFYETRMLDINDELSKWDGYEEKSNRMG
ncbi:Mss4-like protein [Abortiporus biennis]|nr:Mss4-like protein [Abortiporus biennis]